ncbi:MAG: hypothetical protein ABEI31_02845 [Halodesulfurarchaeum sp.]
MAAWKCESCGTVHRSNPSQCRNCGHTVFRRARGEEAPAGGDWVRWAVLAIVALAILVGAIYVLAL